MNAIAKRIGKLESAATAATRKEWSPVEQARRVAFFLAREARSANPHPEALRVARLLASH
jgi:hypothetical protein